MHGLVFVAWEKYLAERFGGTMLDRYRQEIGETAATSPLVSHMYVDAQLLAGVKAATYVTGIPTEQLLYKYGRHFITNSLTRHLCSYLLNQLHNRRDLLLARCTTRMNRQQFAQYMLSLLPKEDGITLTEVQTYLWSRGVNRSLARPALVLEALNHLHHAGLVATSATEPGDSLMNRRYWRIPSRHGS
jgi:hypothetical protein